MAIVNSGNVGTRTGASPQQPKTPCCCPACSGLECLERPRFFANQLLTDTDLTSEQNYMLAKNRLHNRYLHGAGVVCGLEVVCNDCNGSVTVQPGYAIDPCGNDIIVCDATSFDVVKAIEECCRARRRRAKSGCDPYMPPQDDGCKGNEQHWCITIEYLEREARGITPLRNDAPCGCSGGGSCGCGKHSHGASAKNGKACCAPAPMEQPQASACEPSRFLERFKLCVVEDHCSSEERAPGALQKQLVACTQGLKDFLDLIPQQYRTAVQQLEAGTPTGLSAAQLYAVCCAVRQAAIQFLTSRSYRTFCTDLELLPMCPPPPSDQNPLGGVPAGYEATVAAAVQQIMKLVVQSLLQCFCSALLPPCPDTTCDDRLILACVTLRNGKVVEICNFACRQYAGSFPALYYWLSVFPFFNQLGDALKRLCCTPPVTQPAPPNIQGASPSSLSQPYAFHKTVATNLDSVLNQVTFDSIVNLNRPGALAVGAVTGQSAAQAQATLNQYQIQMVERPVNSAAEIPLHPNLLGGMVAYPGDHVVAYTVNHQVVSLAPYSTAEALQDARADIAALRRDLDALKAGAKLPG
jgi:hypothetical protein